jgi:6-phosphogluconolactonase (cycloisomerase 2 family)
MTNLKIISVLFVTFGLVGNAIAQDAGAVYTMTNDPAGNAVVVYARSGNGTLTKSGTFPTGGTSIGFFATGNQNGLLLSNDGHCLWAVNSASNTIVSFQVSGNTSLRRAGSVNSGGTGPVSLTQYQGLLYVLNNGSLFAGTTTPPAPSPDNITGFTVSSTCGLSPLANSTRGLSQSTGTFPAQVSFDPSGRVVVVTEKATNKIDTWVVGSNGLLSGKLVQSSAGHEPFGFAFDNRGQLVVTEAGCHMPTPPGVLPGCSVPPDSPALTSYTVASDGTLILVDHLVDDQAAQCWVVISNNQRIIFTVNALATQAGGTPGLPPAGSITTYHFDPQGQLTKMGDTPVPTALNSLSSNPNAMVGVPVDAALSRNSQYLYVLSEGDGTINSYSVGPSGQLTLLGVSDVTAVSAITVGGPFPNGLAAQ